MILGVASVAGAEGFAALGDVLLNRHVRVAEHNRLGLAALGGQDLEFLAPVTGVTLLDALGFVDGH